MWKNSAERGRDDNRGAYGVNERVRKRPVCQKETTELQFPVRSEKMSVIAAKPTLTKHLQFFDNS